MYNAAKGGEFCKRHTPKEDSEDREWGEWHNVDGGEEEDEDFDYQYEEYWVYEEGEKEDEKEDEDGEDDEHGEKIFRLI